MEIDKQKHSHKIIQTTFDRQGAISKNGYTIKRNRPVSTCSIGKTLVKLRI